MRAFAFIACPHKRCKPRCWRFLEHVVACIAIKFGGDCPMNCPMLNPEAPWRATVASAHD